MPMTKYMCLMRSPPMKREPPSPAQMQQMYASFNAWKEKFKDNLVDLGSPLLPGGKILTTDGVKDGPFVEVKEVVGGYMIVQAETFERALDVARESPGLFPGSSIELRAMGGH